MYTTSAALLALPLLAQSAGGLPDWATTALTPVIVVALLLTGQLRWGKGVDREIAKCDTQTAKAEVRAEAAEGRERALQQAFMDRVLPMQERQLLLMQSVQDFLRTLVVAEGPRR
jgi:hypothetical protein